MIGLIINIVLRFIGLFIPSICLLVIGIFIKPCLYIGLILFIIDVIISLIEQFRIRKTFLADSEDSEFQKFQVSVSKGKNWKNNVMDFVEEKIKEDNIKEDQDDTNE